MKNQLNELASSLEEAASIVRQIPPNSVIVSSTCNVWVTVGSVEAIPQIMKAVGGKIEKSNTDYFIILKRQLGSLDIFVAVPHDLVCERVERTETVEEQVPIAFKTIKTNRTIIEWRCPDSLLKGGADV